MPEWEEVFGAIAGATGDASWSAAASADLMNSQESYDLVAVKRAAELLVAVYGEKALDQARRVEQMSSVKMVARVVRVEVERLCRSAQQQPPG